MLKVQFFASNLILPLIFKTVSVYSVKTQGNELAVIVVNDELWAVLQSISLEGGDSHTSTACLRARQCKRERKRRRGIRHTRWQR